MAREHDARIGELITELGGDRFRDLFREPLERSVRTAPGRTGGRHFRSGYTTRALEPESVARYLGTTTQDSGVGNDAFGDRPAFASPLTCISQFASLSAALSRHWPTTTHAETCFAL
jgi:hypothetical protein